MKTKFLFISMLCFDLAYAGTPAINDLTILYGIAIALLLGIIAVPYLIKFIKNKINKSKVGSHENDSNEIENLDIDIKD